jgi:hypothetical protein
MKKFSCVKLWDYDEYYSDEYDNVLDTYDIKSLEQLALELYENSSFIVFPKEFLVSILDNVLSERFARLYLDINFVWTEENVKEIVRVSELFASASEKACMYAKSIADKLEQEKANNILTDYEIEIQLTPYLKGYKETENECCSFMDVLCKPICEKFGYILTCDYDDNKYFDRSESWNTEPLFNRNVKPLDCFKDKYISYAVHELLDTCTWSFQDIMNISEICMEVKVKHKSFIG